ncbi:hypothetical protein Tco_0912410 [Tanacetum coccineum]
MTNVKKSVAERIHHQRQYDRRVNKRQMQTQESKFDLGEALDASLVVMEAVGQNLESRIQATGQQHTEQPKIINEGRVDQYTRKCQVKSPILDSLLDNKTTEFSNQSLESENISLKSGQHGQILNETSNKAKMKKEIDAFEMINIELEHSMAKLLTVNEHLNKENETLKKHYKDLYDSIKITRAKTIEHTTSLITQNDDLKAQIQEKVFAIAALKNKLRKLKRNSVDTKFARPSVLGKPVLQPLKKQPVVRQPTVFKSGRPKISKPRFTSQVNVEKDLSKLVTQHYLPKGRESALARPYHMITSSASRNSSKNMPKFSSNDMVHNHYLEEAKKNTQEKDKNSKSSVMPSTSLQNTTNGSKPKPRINKTTRILPTSKSNSVTSNVVPLVDHSRNTSPFSDSKHFVCSTCHKCVFNTNHDACITKLLKEIFTGHKFSHNKSSAVYEKKSPRSDLRWKPMGNILNNVGLRWVPTGKIFTSCTSKADSESTNGSNVDISKIHECKQTLNLSAGTSINVQKKQSIDLSAGTSYNVKKENLKVWLLKRMKSQKPMLQGIHS